MTLPASLDLERLPASLRAEIDADTAYLYPPELIEHLTSAMQDWSADAILNHLLAGTAFERLRMEWRFGPITAIQCRANPGHAYHAFVPLQLLLRRAKQAPLIISVHGSSRNARDFRDHFACLAQARDAVVLAPLFPMDMTTSVPDQQYTTLAAERTRADLVLLAMVDELAALLQMTFSRTLMFGFSGGAQFAHRFTYVHPARVQALSIAAPGFVTLPWRHKPWWCGVADLAARFGQAYDAQSLRALPVQMLIGSQDDEPAHVWTLDEMGLTAAEYQRYGHTRLARLQSLADAWRSEGVAVEHTVLDGVGHVAPGPIVEAAQTFFTRHLDSAA